MCARRFDQVAHLGPLVAGEIVHDDNVARRSVGARNCST